MNQKHMDNISLEKHKSFKTKGEKTWLKAHWTVQRALPIKDIPFIHTAAELALS